MRTEKEQREWLYEIHIKENHERYRYNTQSYDKSILTLSSTSLGFSLLAIKYIVPLESACYTFLLVTGWVLLVFSIFCSLVAYIVANKALVAAGRNITDGYLRNVREALIRKVPYVGYNTLLNYATGASFFVAVIVIVLFVILNFPT